MRKVFLENLPRTKTGTRIRWMNSIGYKVKFVYDDIEGEVEIINYDPVIQELIIKYNDKHYNIKTNHFNECKLGNITGKFTSEFKYKIGQRINDNKRDLTIIDRKYIKDKNNKKWKYYKYKCNKCGFDGGKHWSTKDKCYKDELWIEEGNLSSGNGCSCCSIPPQIVVEGINDIPTTDSWMIKYFQGGYDEAKKYTYNCRQKIRPICPDCKRIRNKKISIYNICRNKSIGCNCGDNKSKVSKFMFCLLDQLRYNSLINNFEAEIKFDWCTYYNTYKNKEQFGIYDFLIEENKLIIETDGEFHRKDNLMSGQTKEESKFIDNIKDKLAEENGYKVIRISDEGDIKEDILNSKLNKLFDLNIIDWNKCYKYAERNIVKEICDYWHLHNNINNEDLTTKDLEKNFKIRNVTIRKYLKLGTKYGWCYYNSQEESKKIECKVEIFKDGVSLGIFSNCSELINQSETLFNIKLKASGISLVANGKQKTHKGFTFKYIN